MSKITYAEAIRDALRIEMKRDKGIFIAGEDVGKFGGTFGACKNLLQEFGPERVLNMPISETVIIGLGVGAAAVGMRPCVEIMYCDFIGICLDEIMNQASKMRYMFGGKAKIPMVLRTSYGAGVRGAAQHSQSLEAILAHVPGLKVVMPSNCADVKGLLASSIRDDNPVMFLEHKVLYSLKEVCPEGEYLVPLGKANICLSGNDVTIVTWGLMVQKALKAAQILKKQQINCEVIDIRTLVPLDKETIFESVKKTNRVVIVHEAPKTCGFGAEIAALISDECFEYLDGPIKRVTAPDCIIPFAPNLEDAYMPDENKIANAVIGLNQ